MEIRLAHYQGLLSQPSLNMIQYFAANYWLGMERRLTQDDAEEQLQRQTYYLQPDRYQELFLAGEIGTPEQQRLQRLELDPEQPVDDISEIDRYFEHLDEKKAMSGAQLFGLLDDEDGWV